jgi:hypothetical protein
VLSPTVSAKICASTSFEIFTFILPVCGSRGAFRRERSAVLSPVAWPVSLLCAALTSRCLLDQNSSSVMCLGTTRLHAR